MAKLSIEQQNKIEYQIDKESFPYIYDTKEYPVEVIVMKYEKQEIFVPHYQRSFVWTQREKSNFIESVFLGVPIMPLLVSVSGDNYELEIIDGSQRIRTIVEYINGDLKLTKLEKLTELNNTKFADLPPSVQNKFKIHDFRFHVVTSKADSDIRADIFKRVNTSSNQLKDSEIRKGAYQGEFFNFIQECAKSDLLREICPIPESKEKRGEYEELLLRFFCYSDNYCEFKHDVAKFLDDYLKKKNKGFDMNLYQSEFLNMLNFVKNNFETPYFAKKGKEKSTPRVRFEALAVGINLALRENPDLKIENTEWLESNEFKTNTTSDASNNKGKLQARIEFVRDCLLNPSYTQSLTYDD